MLITCIVVAIVICLFVALRQGPSPAAQPADAATSHSDLLAMETKAQSLVLQGKLAEAHAAYGDLLRRASAGGADDPSLRAIVTRAEAERNRIFQRLTDPQKPQQGQATAPSPTNAEPAEETTTLPSSPSADTDSPPLDLRSHQSSTPPPRDNPYAMPRRQPATSPHERGFDTTIATGEDDPDARIGAAMQHAADYLLGQFNGSQLAGKSQLTPTYRAGLDALCVYALLTASQSLPDPRLSIRGPVMPKLIDQLKSYPLMGNTPRQNDPVVYARSLRALALSVYNRPEDHKALQDDVNWLVHASMAGAYTYDDRYAHTQSTSPPIWDNSNSQYGLLGAWAGAEVAIEVPTAYWRAVEKHWQQTQLKDGRWPYSTYGPHVSLAMTCGGIASLFVTHDYLDAPMLRGAVGREPFPGALGLGLNWLEQGDHSVAIPNRETYHGGYELYALERVGLASGFKFFGSHDWYRELAGQVLSKQFPSGAFLYEEDDAFTSIDTAYTLLFLARGRYPVFMDKLRFEKYWSNRPRDIANLTRFASRDLERPLNWQVVSLSRPWQDWLDSPVLYIASQQPPVLNDADYDKLRGFVDSGGLIFTHADAGSATFNKWVPDLVKKICPDYELQTLAADDPIYSVYYRIPPPHPKLLGISNGSRLLLVHSPTDLASSWQQRDDKMFPDGFHIGVNVFIYAAGKKDFRNRLQSPYVAEMPGSPSRTIPVIRVQYAGNWDPEPYAWVRMGRIFRRQSGEGIGIENVQAMELKSQTAPLAYLTGTADYHFTDNEVAGIKEFVNGGGVLFIDCCGGEKRFADRVRDDLISRAFGAAKASPLAPDSPVFEGLVTDGKPTGLHLRPYAVDKIGRIAPPIQMIHFGKGYVIFTPLDVTSGLLGTSTWNILGYDAKTSEKLITNLVNWAESVRSGL